MHALVAYSYMQCWSCRNVVEVTAMFLLDKVSFVVYYLLIGSCEHFFKRTVNNFLSFLSLIQRGIFLRTTPVHFLIHIQMDVSFPCINDDVFWSLQSEIAKYRYK